MSVQALSCAFAMRGLSPSEKLVLLALSNFANEDMRCWPSQERLADDTELSARTVWGALKSLEDKQLLSRTSRKRQDGTRTTDVFTLNFGAEPVANSAKATRKPCEDHSQMPREPVAAVATLTTFEPSTNHQSEPSSLVALSAPAQKRASKRAPQSWSPSERTLQALAEEGYGADDVTRALTRMRDHEFATARSDWDATFRNWVRRDADLKPRPRNERSYADQRQTAREDSLRAHQSGVMAALNRRLA